MKAGCSRCRPNGGARGASQSIPPGGQGIEVLGRRWYRCPYCSAICDFKSPTSRGWTVVEEMQVISVEPDGLEPLEEDPTDRDRDFATPSKFVPLMPSRRRDRSRAVRAHIDRARADRALATAMATVLPPILPPEDDPVTLPSTPPPPIPPEPRASRARMWMSISVLGVVLLGAAIGTQHGANARVSAHTTSAAPPLSAPLREVAASMPLPHATEHTTTRAERDATMGPTTLPLVVVIGSKDAWKKDEATSAKNAVAHAATTRRASGEAAPATATPGADGADTDATETSGTASSADPTSGAHGAVSASGSSGSDSSAKARDNGAAPNGTREKGAGGEMPCEIAVRDGARALAKGDFAVAQAAFRKAMALNPAFVPARLGHADATWELGDTATARGEYAALVADGAPALPPRARLRGHKAGDDTDAPH